MNICPPGSGEPKGTQYTFTRSGWIDGKTLKNAS